MARTELRAITPSYMAYCGTCRTVTLHMGVTDDHGCERGSQCQVCEAVNRPIECQIAARLPQRARKAS